MTKPEMIELARSIAVTFGLESELVCAICEQESSWNPLAVRFEPGFKAMYVDRIPGLTAEERVDRSTSWGLLQLMGQVARELGFMGQLDGLLVPEVGLAWGCRHLEGRIKHADGNMEKALLLWNGGGNKGYPAQVLARMDNYKSEDV